MNSRYLIILVIFICSCNKHINDASSNPNNDVIIKGEYNKALYDLIKRDVLFDCLNHSYQVKGNDLSVSVSYVYDQIIYKESLMLTKKVIEAINLDSTNRTNRICRNCDWKKDSLILKNLHNEMMIGSKTLEHCLDYYNSSQLDSFAILYSRG